VLQQWRQQCELLCGAGQSGRVHNKSAEGQAILKSNNVGEMRVLDMRVTPISFESAGEQVQNWIDHGASAYICVRDVHGVMQSRSSRELLSIHDRAGLVITDGMPLVWLAWLRGYTACERLSGADFVDYICKLSEERGWRNYFYGGKPGIAELMVSRLREKYPALPVAGTDCPPFSKLTEAEKAETAKRILSTGPNIVWVGLSTPKQELWMSEFEELLPGTILVGVGAAFDFHAGAVKRAPRWMQSAGLEWFYRLASEPRRLWRRYVVLAPLFVALIMAEELRLYRARNHHLNE
jgi:N-acetylglucosaminyldiphosphoundecaprenol N-acetyl-beta-D-mannosaminyltransferase